MNERVVVAMSGGVDSSVAAALLVEQGYDVIGVMMRLWAEEAPADAGAPATNKCCSLESIYDARAVADRLKIPFYVVNAETPFKSHVVDFFIQEYASARTPNPCLACNRHIRFGFLLDYARKLGATHLATGHYARVSADSAGRYHLYRGADPAKDQSYVLHVARQAQLAHMLFPVGSYVKSEVRALAAARGLPTASRAESQDLCFLADGDYRRFLKDWVPEAVQPGPIVDRAGRQLGTHRGLPFYTVGQRSGLGIAAPHPLYVLELDAQRNAVVVGTGEELGHQRLWAENVNWIAGETPAEPFQTNVQIRYHARPAPALVVPLDGDRAEVRFDAPQRGVMAGQGAVFYAGDECLGGGIISNANA
jgi:tRNA-specific 2-thiouridylase